MITKKAGISLAVMIVLTAVSGCGKGGGPVDSAAVSPFATFRDIPGVTAEEIAAIDAIKKEFGSLVYGMPTGIEAFKNDEGVIQGYSALFCEWLSALFGIPFVPSLHAWSDLLGMLEDGRVDFTGEMRATPERRKVYFMTDAIGGRTLKQYHLADIEPFGEIVKNRPLRYGLIEGSASTILNHLEDGTYTMAYIQYIDEVPGLLLSGELDAFIHSNSAEANFIEYGDIIANDFLPIIKSPVSLTARNPRLEPIITIVTKALRNGAMPHLNYLYNKGYQAYKINKFFIQLSKEEKAYLKNPSPIPLAARYFNYPIDFYNTYEQKWEGLAFDVLREVEALTGLTFTVVNDKHANLSELYEMVRVGDAYLVPELLISNERRKHYIWTERKFITDQYALISKSHLPNVSVDEISNMRVGLIRNTVRAELFRTWFPGAANVTEYATDEEAMFAVERGDVDMVMSSKNRMISYLNYYGLLNYKTNYLFNYPYEATFGFNKNQEVLCSIVDKAIGLIDTYIINEQWMTRSYDYKMKMIEARMPWLVGATILSLVVLGLVLVLFFRKRNEEKRLEVLVQKRTAEIEQQRKLLEYMSLTDPLTGLPNRRNFDMRLDIEWQIAIREKQRISFLMLDIDHFKKYNDQYGHQQGDEVLRIIARTIEDTPKRPGDFVARWGGEEFAVLLSNTGTRGALKIAEALRANIEKTNLFVNGSAAKLTVSIGVNTQVPVQDSSLSSFIAVADKELYRAKESGRNRICFPQDFYEKLG
jgi:diguanylate cyclase (GGDEF)-like protein